MRQIDLIIVHCSASDNPHHDNLATIKQWHLGRGFSDVGYHFIVLKSGEVVKGRDIEQVGAHCEGHNKNSIGICLTGDKLFSEEQFISLRALIRELIGSYALGTLDVLPHNAFNKNKTCPNFDLDKILENLFT